MSQSLTPMWTGLVKQNLPDGTLLELASRLGQGVTWSTREDRAQWLDHPKVTAQAAGMMLSRGPEEAMARLGICFGRATRGFIAYLSWKIAICQEPVDDAGLVQLWKEYASGSGNESYRCSTSAGRLMSHLHNLGIPIDFPLNEECRRDIEYYACSAGPTLSFHQDTLVLVKESRGKDFVQVSQLAERQGHHAMRVSTHAMRVATIVEVLDWLLDLAIRGWLHHQKLRSGILEALKALPTEEIRLRSSSRIAHFEKELYYSVVINEGARPGPALPSGRIAIDRDDSESGETIYSLLVRR